MGEMKSAFELAMERARKLGDASDEERRAMEEKEFAPVGRKLAESYLRGGDKLEDLLRSLDRQQRGRDVALSAARSRLVEGLAEGDCERPLEALLALAGDRARVEAAAGRARDLCRQQQETKQRRLDAAAREIEQARRRELAARGISGSAIGIEAGATEEWQRLSAELDAGLRQAVEALRSDLLG